MTASSDVVLQVTISPGSIHYMSTFQNEIKLCDIICGNCHAIETANERKSRPLSMKPTAVRMRNNMKPRQDIVLAEKLKRGSCIDCKLKFTAELQTVFEFDHLPKFTKTMNISRMVVQLSEYSLDDIENEMQKCDLRCIRCHRIMTTKRRDENKPSSNENTKERGAETRSHRETNPSDPFEVLLAALNK
jgi:hypothetical protein